MSGEFAATMNIFSRESMFTGVKARDALKLWGTSLFCLWAAGPSWPMMRRLEKGANT